MPDVTETQLPGVGVRHEFETSAGERVAILAHRGGRREVLVYDASDPDRCTTVLHLSSDDTRTLAEMLGASQVSQALSAVEQQVEGLAIDWVTVAQGSRMAGETIGSSNLRAHTGASIVALVRDKETIAAPGPEHELVPGDVAVAVGTPDGLQEFRDLLSA
ncbi:MAG: cation:proton antiporter regulatory subunit [Actinobacteria bacterium]|nr:cation:proton antiporter regulatory subunit [Actinomycetota bacterium]